VPLFRRANPARSIHSAITAAAKVLTSPSGEAAPPGSAQPWQVEAFDLADRVPEGGYVLSFVGDAFSRVTLGVGRVNDEGVTEAYDADSGDPAGAIAAALVRDLRAPVGGQPQFLRSTGVNLALAGEFYLVGIPSFDPDDDPPDPSEAILPIVLDPDRPGTLDWEVLSVLELGSKGSGDSLRYTRLGGNKDEEMPVGTIASRVWIPDFRFTRHSRSMFRSVLPTLRKLILLDARTVADFMSRQNAGLLIVPSEGDWPSTPENPDGFSKFVDDLVLTMTAGIKDPSSAASIVPNVVEFKGDRIEQWRHLDFARDNAYEANERRDGLVTEMARGVQLPVEVTTGAGASNHWNAWLADESLVKTHLEPLLEIAVDGYTSTYLHPSMKALDVDPDEAERWVVTHDTTELVSHPSRGDEATEGYDRGELSGHAWRRYHGFTEADAPDPAELERRRQLRDVIAKPGAAAPEGQAAGPPDQPGDLSRRVADAAEATIGRAVERAGNRLRNKLNGRPGVRDLVAATPPAEVAATLGPAMVDSLVTSEEMFVGEFGHLARTARRWATTAGHPQPGLVAERVMAAAELLARERLYDPDRMPVPADFAEALR